MHLEHSDSLSDNLLEKQTLFTNGEICSLTQNHNLQMVFLMWKLMKNCLLTLT